MAQKQIPEPTQDAFDKGALNLEWIRQLVDAVNTPLEVKGGGGKFVFSKENTALVLDGEETLCYIIKNGEPRRCRIRIKFE